jgi:hypothetical protein
MLSVKPTLDNDQTLAVIKHPSRCDPFVVQTIEA